MNKMQRDRIIQRLRSFATTKSQNDLTRILDAQPNQLPSMTTVEQMVSGIRDGSISICPGKEQSNLLYSVASDLIWTRDVPRAVQFRKDLAACEKLRKDMTEEIERVHDSLIFENVGDVQKIMDDFAAKFAL